MATCASGSLDELRPLYTSDALIWANERNAVIGWHAVRAMFGPSFARDAIDAPAHLFEARRHGDAIQSSLRFLTKVRLEPTDGGAFVVVAFRDFALLQRSGANWAILRNMDQPITIEPLRADIEREPPLIVAGCDAEARSRPVCHHGNSQT